VTYVIDVQRSESMAINVLQQSSYMWCKSYGSCCLRMSPRRSTTVTECAEEQGSLYVFLSEAAIQGLESPKSMRMMGQIHGVDIMILVDS
jgi:hypothetical protein